MRLPLLFLLLLSARSISSKLANSKNVSLTTELLTHTGDNTNHKFNINRQHNCDSTDIHTNLNYSPSNRENLTNTPLNNDGSLTLINNDTQTTDDSGIDNDKPGNNERIQSIEGLGGKGDSQSLLKNGPYKKAYDEITRKAALMVCPFKPSPSMLRALKHSFRALRLSLVPSVMGKSDLCVLFMTTFFSTVIGGSVFYLAVSDDAFKKLRDKWAFQGEIGKGSVERYTKFGLILSGVDLLFRNLLLRGAFLSTLYKSNFLTNTNWMTNNLAKVDRGLMYKLLSGFSKGFTVTRLGVMTLLQYELMKSNWNTGSFMVDHETSKFLSKFVFSMFLFSLTEHLAYLFFYGNFSRFLDLQYLLEPLEYRETYRKLLVYNEHKDFYFSLPDWLKRLYNNNSRVLFNVYGLLKSLKWVLPYDVEWIFFCLYLSMALYANSAAGIYLSLFHYVFYGFEDSIIRLEKSFLEGGFKFVKLFE
ncbi:putative integral membrane protein [Theileria parva strain Muguga]|uniref:Uncharacterized protein n=1 Tax=Theileria parva TaxID=5875 RepID=Q4N4U7_THEPA|nr:putative integral membrane protein [Theileria parva strain Muguga]EAN32826.1 putative integral membrane protein [Theileria parva strain Muguga]|eukprot:XP_765109.1 hypothetical protein [Theileria parva strain Muguga]